VKADESGDLKMTVFGQKHRRSQATRATTNVSCAVCRTNVVTDNSKRMTVTVVGGRKNDRQEAKHTGWGGIYEFWQQDGLGEHRQADRRGGCFRWGACKGFHGVPHL
jgi:hypothetical protein